MEHWRREVERFTGMHPFLHPLCSFRLSFFLHPLPTLGLFFWRFTVVCAWLWSADLYPVVYHGDQDDKESIREFEWLCMDLVCAWSRIQCG
jgi:hypothetical protein